MLLPDPPEMGNEDEVWLSLCDRAAVNSGIRICRCSHLEIRHVGGMCLHRACGCFVFRPRNTASPARETPAAGRSAA